MNALRFDRVGEPSDVIQLRDAPIPQPQAGEVRLRVVRSPIHNHDLSTIRGTYGVTPQLPAIGGTEVLGIVDALGHGVALAVGTRVSAMVQGGWAEYVLAPAQICVPIPDAIIDDHAAQLMAMPLSALVLLNSLRVEPGAWIVQNAANGAVGRILMQLAQARKINVINLVRRESAAERLRTLGAQHVVVTEVAGWEAQVRALTQGAPIARVIDSVAGAHSIALQHLLGRFGEYVIFGGLAAQAMRIDPGVMIFNETIVRGFWMTAWMARASADERRAAIGEIFALVLVDALPLSVAGVYSLSQFQAALAQAEQSGRDGKVLFAP